MGDWPCAWSLRSVAVTVLVARCQTPTEGTANTMLTFVRIVAVLVIAVIAYRVCATSTNDDLPMTTPTPTTNTYVATVPTMRAAGSRHPVEVPQTIDMVAEHVGVVRVFDVFTVSDGRRYLEWDDPVEYSNVVTRPSCPWVYEYAYRTDTGEWVDLGYTHDDHISWDARAVRVRIIWVCDTNNLAGPWRNYYG